MCAAAEVSEDRTRAAELYAEAIRLDPRRVAAYLHLATLLLERGERVAAIEILATALEHDPRSKNLQALMVDALAGRDAGTTRTAHDEAAGP